MSDVTPQAPPVSGVPEAYGVGPAVPVASRGNSLILAVPPSPAYATAVLAAATARDAVNPTRPILLIAPESALEPWAQAAAHAAQSVGKSGAVGPFPSRAAHHLSGGRVDLLVTTLATALELIRRSALSLDRIAALVVAWPEHELSDESFLPLFADLPKETQRIVVTADPRGVAGFVERYAWRAPVVGPLGGVGDSPALPRLRSAVVRWDDRLTALAAAADLLDVDELVVWTADRSSHGILAERLASHGVAARAVAGTIPDETATVFFDPPPPELLSQANPERAVALVPPGTESYYGRIVGRLEPLRLPGPLDEAERGMMEDRKVIRAKLEAGTDRGAYATVAPLFERWSPAEIAVALQALWTDSKARPPAPLPIPAPKAVQRAKVWTNVGRKDNATLGEVLGLLTLDLGISRTALGRVDMKDTFTIIEFGSDHDAQQAVEKLAGAAFKGRRLAARIDRGREPRRTP